MIRRDRWDRMTRRREMIGGEGKREEEENRSPRAKSITLGGGGHSIEVPGPPRPLKASGSPGEHRRGSLERVRSLSELAMGSDRGGCTLGSPTPSAIEGLRFAGRTRFIRPVCTQRGEERREVIDGVITSTKVSAAWNILDLSPEEGTSPPPAQPSSGRERSSDAGA